MGRAGLTQSGRRVAENSVKSAEKSIMETECILPEGKGRQTKPWNELEMQRESTEEMERRRKFAVRTPPNTEPFANSGWGKMSNYEGTEKILDKIGKMQKKLNEVNNKLNWLAKDVQELSQSKGNETKKGENGQQNNWKKGNTNMPFWRQHDDNRFRGRGTGANRGRGLQRPFQYGWRGSADGGWKRKEQQQQHNDEVCSSSVTTTRYTGEEFTRMAGYRD
ncbi:hypothetical protein niasHT_028892 [Heterodera trifolii]|uniref:Uncharacterized protein n=1 Tax=Heterodera trifolii TaxID=157864 RepID=A0ABD2KJ39_9BILA